MSSSKLGFCETCQCDIWLEPYYGGWAGTCPNCGCFKTYGKLHYEPDPVDMDLLVFKAGEDTPTWHFTNRAHYHEFLNDPSYHWAVEETGELVKVDKQVHPKAIAHRLPCVMVHDGGEVRSFDYLPDMDIWADRNYKTVESEGIQLLGGKYIQFFKVVN